MNAELTLSLVSPPTADGLLTSAEGGPSQACPEACLFGDSRSQQADVNSNC